VFSHRSIDGLFTTNERGSVKLTVTLFVTGSEHPLFGLAFKVKTTDTALRSSGLGKYVYEEGSKAFVDMKFPPPLVVHSIELKLEAVAFNNFTSAPQDEKSAPALAVGAATKTTS